LGATPTIPIPFDGGGDGAGGVRPVAVVVLRSEARNRHATGAIDTVRDVDVLPEIWVVEINAGIDVTRQH